MNTMVDFVRNLTLSEIDVDRDPIMVAMCGHAFSMLTMDSMLDMDQFYTDRTDYTTEQITYVGTQDLNGCEVNPVACLFCQKPIVGIKRYGRQMKQFQLTQSLKRHYFKQAQDLKKALKGFKTAQENAETESLLTVIACIKAKSQTRPPQAWWKRTLGTFENEFDEFPNSDFKSIPECYGIPRQHHESWTILVGPAMKSLEDFTETYHRSLKSPVQEVHGVVGLHLNHPEPEPKASETNLRVNQDWIAKCGLPIDSQGNFSAVEALHGRTNVVIWSLMMAFSALDATGVHSGWYWFVEDLIQCAWIHVDMLEDAAVRRSYHRKATMARVMRMDLIYKSMAWIAMKPYPNRTKGRATRRDQINEHIKDINVEIEKVEQCCTGNFEDECLKARASVISRMNVAIKAAMGGDVFMEASMGKCAYLFETMDTMPSSDGQWVLCKNGHGVSYSYFSYFISVGNVFLLLNGLVYGLLYFHVVDCRQLRPGAMALPRMRSAGHKSLKPQYNAGFQRQ
jgi:hypothetical protein